jgi:hypothetical protein
MMQGAAAALTAQGSAVGSEITTAEIRLIWSAMRRTGSTLGRLRQMAVGPTRTLRLAIPGATEERAHTRMTSWRQII